jgi:hypothetical protein
VAIELFTVSSVISKFFAEEINHSNTISDYKRLIGMSEHCRGLR